MRLPSVHRRWVVGFVACYVVLACLPLTADEPAACCPQPRPQDQVWLVSNRGLGCNVEQQVDKLRYWRYDREKCWVRSNLAELQDADDGNLNTTVFVHGNRIESCEAFTNGWSTYRALMRCADERPIRFIIWSWPSEPLRGLLNDARTKAWRTDPAAYYLAWFVDQLDPEARVGLWGHSYGARIVTGALHLLGGGQVGGHRLLERAHASRRPMQAVLVAAALDNHWLLPGRAHGNALSQVDRMLLVNNSCDALLKRYHLVRACQEALGYTGLHRLDSDARNKIQQIDACCEIGKRHQFAGYLCSAGLMSRMRSELLSEPADVKAAPSNEVAAGPLLAVEP